MVVSYVRDRDISFSTGWRTWSGCSTQPVDRDAAFEAWRDGYREGEYAGQVTAADPP